MCRIQKIAFFTLVIFGVAAITSAISVIALQHFFGWPVASAGFSFMGISGFAGLAPLFFKKGLGKITCDERDKLINRTAALGGFAGSYLWLCLAGTTLLVCSKSDTINKTGLILLIFGGMFIVATVHSTVILIMYGRGSNGEK